MSHRPRKMNSELMWPSFVCRALQIKLAVAGASLADCQGHCKSVCAWATRASERRESLQCLVSGRFLTIDSRMTYGGGVDSAPSSLAEHCELIPMPSSSLSTSVLLCLCRRYCRVAITTVKRVKTAPMTPKTIVIVRVSEASELFELVATGSTLAHGPCP